METKEVLSLDAWVAIFQFLYPVDIIVCAVTCKHLHQFVYEVSETHHAFYAQQTLWRHICLTYFKDNSREEKERRQKNKNVFNNFTESMYDQFSFEFKTGNSISLLDYSALENTPSHFVWRTLFDRIIQRREEWKDNIKPTKIKKKRSDFDYHLGDEIKPTRDRNILRYIVCGFDTARKDLFLNKLIKAIGKETDMYDIALPSINQVITLHNIDVRSSTYAGDTSLTQLTTLMLYTADKPYHFMKSFRGAHQVNGIIYLVDPDRFPDETYEHYRDFHDMAGEYQADVLSNWVVVVNGENFELVNGPAQWTCVNHLGTGNCRVTKTNHSTAVDAVMNVLRINSMTVCEWYSSAQMAISDTNSENMRIVIQEWLACTRQALYAFDGEKETRSVIYMHGSSDEEDEYKSNKHGKSKKRGKRYCVK
jgi:hypothetical protein